MKNVLLNDAAWTRVRGFCCSSALFCFDFDGTLAAIEENPADVAVSPRLQEALVELSTLASVAIISGRMRSDLRKYVEKFAHYTFGNHGAEDGSQDAREPAVLSWHQTLIKPLQDLEGVWIENKGLSLSVHYRQAPNQGFVMRRLSELTHHLNPKPKIIGGKYVFNLVPNAAPNKAQALLGLMEKENFSSAIFLGDDLNDEDVFRLKTERVLSIKIGEDRLSEAAYFLEAQCDVEAFLKRCLSELKQKM